MRQKQPMWSALPADQKLHGLKRIAANETRRALLWDGSIQAYSEGNGTGVKRLCTVLQLARGYTGEQADRVKMCSVKNGYS